MTRADVSSVVRAGLRAGPAPHPACPTNSPGHCSSSPDRFTATPAVFSPPLVAAKYPEGWTLGKPARPCGPHRRARLSRPQARMRVHVVPAVGQGQRCGARPPQRRRPSRPRGKTRVARGMFEVEPVKAGHLESPGCHRVNRPRAHALSPGRRDGPVRRRRRCRQRTQVVQGGAAEQEPLPASATAQCAPVSAAQPPASPRSTPASRPGSPPAAHASAGSPHPDRRPSRPGHRRDSTAAAARRCPPSTWAEAAPQGNRPEQPGRQDQAWPGLFTGSGLHSKRAAPKAYYPPPLTWWHTGLDQCPASRVSCRRQGGTVAALRG